MATRKPLNNSTLTGMFIAGGALLLIGLIVWVANTDFNYDPGAYSPGRDTTSPAGQSFGGFLAGFGGMLLVLGWTAAAICRQIADRD